MCQQHQGSHMYPFLQSDYNCPQCLWSVSDQLMLHVASSQSLTFCTKRMLSCYTLAFCKPLSRLRRLNVKGIGLTQTSNMTCEKKTIQDT